MDDTFAAHKAEHTQQFLINLNSLDPHIHFTMEAPNQQGFLPSLDTLVLVGTNESLVTTVYRKPTHNDQYLNWYSHPNITDKYNIFNTLTYRAHTVCSNQQL